MRLNLFLLVICIAFAFQTNGQTCTGSLGDPVIKQDFGSGTNPGLPLASFVTNMTYTTNNCPNDGEYTISNSLVGAGNCHPPTWYNVTKDHTGNPNGYMMIINASYQPNIFFTQTARGLCANTTYEFSTYILNLCIPSLITASYTQPNITFSIQTTTGQPLGSYTTGTIAPSSYNQGPLWRQLTTYFTTPANVTDVLVEMTNNAPGGNGNDFILDDITFRACGPIIQQGFSAPNGPISKKLCAGSNANYTLKAQVIGDVNPVYQWQSNYSGHGWVDMAGKTNPSLDISFVNAVAGSYQYRLGVANGSGITDAQCRVYAPPLTVTVNPLPVVPPFPPQAFCEGKTLTLAASGGASYTWTGPNMAPTTQNPLVINNVTQANAGIYTVVAVSDSGCTAAPVQASVTVVPKVVASVSTNAVTICAGESAQLNASGGTNYKWTPSTGLSNDAIPNPVATPLQTTKYTVNVGNNGCSDSTKSVTVTVNQIPIANAGNDITLFEGESATLNGTVKGDNTSYSWSPATFLNDPTSLTPVTTPTENTTYTLTAVSQTCGTSTSSVFVKVYKKIKVPNTFSPNNDGVNDYWDIHALSTYPQCSVMIYNRWGQQVYQSTGYAKPWDGIYNSSPLPTGTYYYIIDLKNNTPKLAGWVLIVR